MKLVVTGDLHYDITRSAKPAREVAEAICGLRADALLILGDAAGRDARILRDCLHLFDRFDGRKFFVAGNHDIWTEPGREAVERLEHTLPRICRQAGFHPLDVEPAVIGRVGLVGSIGWYDYGFRATGLGIPLRFYEAKVAPGAAARLEGCEHLLADMSDVPPTAMEMGARWMDGRHVHLPMSDADFCRHLCDRLRRHLAQVAAQAEAIVVGMHHLPFRELVPAPAGPRLAFALAYMGSATFGEALLAEPKVRCVLSGHSHWPMRTRVGHIECINVGCTYVAKRYEILDMNA